MDASQILEKLSEASQAIFQKGSRYQAEKIAIVVAFILNVIIVGTVALAVGGSDPSRNALGADFGRTRLGQLDQQIFFVENTGRGAWTKVRVVINQKYLYTADKLPGRQRIMLKPEDMEYFYYIPRPWGRNDWEDLVTEPKPEATAAESMRPLLVQIRASEGRVDIDPIKKEQ